MRTSILLVAGVVLVTTLAGCAKGELDKDATTLLHWSAERGDIEVIDRLIADGVSLDQPDGRARSPLMVAAEENQAEAVLRLLEAGANHNVRLTGGRTLLHWAAENGNLAALQMIVDASANGETSGDGEVSHSGAPILERVDEDGLTPVERAAYFDQREAVIYLIEQGSITDRYWVDRRGVIEALIE